MKHFITLVLTCLCLHIQGNNKQQVKDSLLRIYLAAPHDSNRLETLNDIAQLNACSPTFLYYQNKLLKEATAQKDLRYQSLAIYNHIRYHYNRLDLKNTELWVHELEQLARNNTYYADYCKGKKMLIELYTLDHKIELAINEALDMHKQAQKFNDHSGMREAYLCLLSNYFETMRYQEGIAALNSAFKLIKPEDPPLEKITIYSKAVLVYSTMHDNKKMLRNLQELEKATNDFLSQGKSILAGTHPILFFFLETHYALYYTRNGQSAEALSHLQNAGKYIEPTSFLPYRIAYLTAYAEYYQLIKENEKALSYWDAAIQQMTPLSLKEAMMFNIQKANLLVEMGLAEEALPLYKKIIKTKDSLYTDLSTSQMEEIQSLYNMDKLMLQQNNRLSTFNHICLLVLSTILIALLFFNIRTYRSRKRLQIDESEMKRLTKIAEEANEIKSNFLTNMSYNIRIPLNNVVGFSQLMSENSGLSEEDRKEYSSIIQNNSTMLIQLVNDVLDLSRLEANMMKFQLCDFSVQEWCCDLPGMAQMHSDGNIQLKLDAEVGDAMIHTDINRLNQFVLSMLIYPIDYKVPREVTMNLTYHVEKNEVSCRIENSPLADPMFASQKVAIRRKINELFFKHFNGTYKMEEKEDGRPILFFTYPTLTI